MAQSVRAPKQQGEEKDSEGFDFYEAENSPTVIGRDQARQMEEHLALQPHEKVYDKSGTEESNPNPNSKNKSEDQGVPSKDRLAKEEASPQDYEESLYRSGSSPAAGDHGSHYHKGLPDSGILARLTANKRKVGVYGGFGAALAGLLIAGFLALLPLKVLSIVNNLQNHFYATSESAVQKETDRMFSNYLKKYVLPANRKCPRLVDKSCNPIPLTSNPVSRLYRGWRNARLEDKLSTKYGLEFGYSPATKHYYLKTPSTKNSEINIDGFANSDQTLDEFIATSNDPELKKVSRAEVRQAVRDSLANETQWKRVMYRYKVGRLLEQKYGIKRCITNIGCKISDKISDTVIKPKNAAKAYIAERVLKPRSQIIGDVFTCLYIDPGCQPENASVEPCTEGQNCATNGAPQSDEDRKIQTKLDSMVASFAGEDAFKIYKEINDSGSLSQYLVKQVLQRFLEETTAKTAADKIPIIGWINLAAQVVNKTEHIGPAAKKLAYAVNAASMVQLYATYRTYADETKSGNVSAADVGAFTDTLGPNPTADKGGSAGAEQAPSYNYLMGSANSTAKTSATLFGGLFGTAYAASTTTAADPSYLCDNHKPPTGLICPEESLDSGNAIASGATNVINSPELAPIKVVADAWNKTIGHVFGFANSIGGVLLNPVFKLLDSGCGFPYATHVIAPGYCEVKDVAQKYSPQIIDAATNAVLPNPFSNNMGGGRTVVLAGGGADVSGNDFSHNGLGGRKLTDQEASTIVYEQAQQRSQQYQDQSFIARMFDTQSDQSPVTKLAMAMPHSVNSASTSIASLFSNPFGKIASVFGSIFTLPAHAAAPTAQPDIYGVVQYGYTDSDIAAVGDPETYWDQHCADNPTLANGSQTQSWNQEAAKNLDSNYLPTNTTTNPCLLIQAATGSNGAMYDSSLLTADDLGAAGLSAVAPASESSSSTLDTNHLYDDSSSVACASGTQDLGTQDGYHNGQIVKIKLCAVSNLPSTSEESNGGFGVSGANGKTVVNSRVSGAVLALVDAAAKDGVALGANSGFRTMAHQQALWAQNPDPKRVAPPGTSNHQMGLAIDFAGLPSTPGPVSNSAVWNWLSQNAAKFGYKNYPAEAWHWSPTGN